MLRSGLELMERAATHKTQYVGLGQRVEVIDDVDAKNTLTQNMRIDSSTCFYFFKKRLQNVYLMCAEYT